MARHSDASKGSANFKATPQRYKDAGVQKKFQRGPGGTPFKTADSSGGKGDMKVDRGSSDNRSSA